jgi:soluble lytic murein transglycosylase-like protein
MRACFHLAAVVAALAGVSAPAGAEPVRKVTSVVRADTRTGRLIRSVVVQPRTVAPKVIAPATAYDAATERATGVDPGEDASLHEIIEHMAQKYEVDPLLVHSVIQVESNYDQYAVSRVGAEGLMQLMPATARRFGVRNSFDAKKNIEGGVKYLKYLQDLHGDDDRALRQVLAAYNAGEGAVAKYGGAVPRYAETEAYVYKVAKRLGEARRKQKAQVARNETAEAATSKEAGKHRPVESFLDDNGRLHLRTK